MRLGEGTGAVLAMNIIEAALRTHREMATFAEAGVSTREEQELTCDRSSQKGELWPKNG